LRSAAGSLITFDRDPIAGSHVAFKQYLGGIDHKCLALGRISHFNLSLKFYVDGGNNHELRRDWNEA
jgi:hypothetical protein